MFWPSAIKPSILDLLKYVSNRDRFVANRGISDGVCIHLPKITYVLVT